MGRIAAAAEVDVEAIKAILTTATSCPTMAHLQAFAAELVIPIDTLVTAAKADGCEFEAPAPTDNPAPASTTPEAVAATIEAVKAALVPELTKLVTDSFAAMNQLVVEKFTLVETRFAELIDGEGDSTEVDGAVTLDTLSKQITDLMDLIKSNDAAMAEGLNMVLGALDLTDSESVMAGKFGKTTPSVGEESPQYAAVKAALHEMRKNKS